MIITVQMKDPDSLHEAIEEALYQELAEINNLGLDEYAHNAIFESRREKANAVAAKWFEYKEYLTVQIDTEAGTCTVLEVAR